MPRRVAQNVSFTPEHAALIASQVASGRFKGVSAVVRAALHAFQEQEEKRPASSPASGAQPKP